ncbi:MAG: nitrate/nitrite transporter NrtS [Chloroflexi bacterium]|nr:nitrate/nitrite transporter NrtS [Chloroflexota bacterium]
MVKRSFVAAALVGTLLTLLNQGDILISGHWNNALYWKIPLTYCVPFLVATYGALTSSRR